MSNMIKGNYLAMKDEAWHGMITGTVTISSGTTFTNHGMLCSDVIVEEGAYLLNHGTINGNVIGRGNIETWGIIQGEISLQTHSIIHQDAIVHGQRY